MGRSPLLPALLGGAPRKAATDGGSRGPVSSCPDPRTWARHCGEPSRAQSSALGPGGADCSGQGSRPALLGVTQAAPEAVSFMLTVSMRTSGASPRC